MFIDYEERPSDSPFVENVWRCRSGQAGSFLSIAASRCEVVLSRLPDRTFLTFRGPETKATSLTYPAGAEWIGIRFPLGTFMPRLLPIQLRDRQDLNLPEATTRSFWLNGSALEYPTFDRAETFIAHLVRRGEIDCDTRVSSFLRGQATAMSLRSVQRHVLRATGLTVNTLRQIERARQAARLLQDGFSILDVVRRAGYYDQAHLTRSLKHRLGQTPTELQRGRHQLSISLRIDPPLAHPYKTPSRRRL